MYTIILVLSLEDDEVWAVFKDTKTKDVALSSFPRTMTMLHAHHIVPNLRLVSIFMNRATAVKSIVTGLAWF